MSAVGARPGCLGRAFSASSSSSGCTKITLGNTAAANQLGAVPDAHWSGAKAMFAEHAAAEASASQTIRA